MSRHNIRRDVRMSENKKRKPKKIHVDKLIIKANEVFFEHDQEKPKREEEGRREHRTDPWGFFSQNWGMERNREDDQKTVEATSEEKRTSEKEANEEEDPRGWSWI